MINWILYQRWFLIVLDKVLEFVFKANVITQPLIVIKIRTKKDMISLSGTDIKKHKH